jgi:hypothetical protein
MTCARARQLLGAYRRDDWRPGELEALGRHLSGCAECRRVEASYRRVGEGIRQLPSITPPASLREAVFAAIRAEEDRGAPSLTQLTTEETQPRLPALRRGARTAPTTRRPLVLGARTAVAVAAVLLFSLFSLRLVPALAQSLPLIASSISTAVQQATGGAAGPRVEQYPTHIRSGHITAAMASNHWVAYVAADASGGSMLYAENRSARQSLALLPAPLDTPIEVRGVSDHWVIWLAGSGTAASPWTLWASRLTAQGAGAGSVVAGQPLALVSSGSGESASSAPAQLGGVWIGGDVVLVAATKGAGDSTLVRLDLASRQGAPATQIVARAQAPGHLLTDPSAAGSTYYWAEVWVDGTTGLHSDIWQSDGSGQAHQVTHDGESFAPRVAGQSLVWVRPSVPVYLDASVVAGQPAAAAQRALAQLGGSIHARDLRSGQGRQVSAHAAASSLEVAGALVVWRDGGQTHTYDLAHGGPSAVDSQVHTAAYAGANGTALAWGQSGSVTIDVYDDDH